MDDQIRLPCSSPRAGMGYVKLLRKINQKLPYGFSFEGTLYKPGKLIPKSHLWPTGEYPKVPLLLECAGTQNPKDGRPSTRHWPTLYILWQFDPARDQWSEAARSASESWDWAADLQPIAKRLLLEGRGGIEIFRGADQVARRISELLDQELESLAPPERGRALGILHDQFCSQFVRL